MVGDKYILEPEAILDHCVAAEGKRWYLVKWKPKWVKKHQLPEGVFDKWEAKKAKRAKFLEENPGAEPEEEEEEETGFKILEERRVIPGQEPEDKDEDENGEGEEDEDEEDEDELDEDEEEEDEDEEGMEDIDEEDEEKFDPNGVDVKEEPDDPGYTGQNGLNVPDDELNTLSSIDRDIVLNELPGDAEVKDEVDIKEEEDKISIPTDYSKPYS